jgi:hypothetical protein
MCKLQAKGRSIKGRLTFTKGKRRKKEVGSPNMAVEQASKQHNFGTNGPGLF